MRFCAVEYAVPTKLVTNTEIIQEIISRSTRYLTQKALDLLALRLDELFKKSVTDVRYHRAKNERAIQFGIEAGKNALASSNMSPKDIDLLIYVGVGRGYIEPATANVFQKILKLNKATCFDILDACASWLRAIHVAHSFIKTGMYLTFGSMPILSLSRSKILNSIFRHLRLGRPRPPLLSVIHKTMTSTTPPSGHGETSTSCARYRCRILASTATAS